MNKEFRLKKINKTRNYFLGEIEKSQLIRRKHKKVCTILNYIETFLFSTYNQWMYFNFFFCSFTQDSYRNYEFCNKLKICAIAAGSKKFKSIIKKNIKKHDQIVLLVKSESNSIEVLIYEALIDSNINHDEFVLINNVLIEYDNMKQKIKNLKT